MVGRDHNARLACRHYVDTTRAVIEAAISENLPPLKETVLQLQARLELSSPRARNVASPDQQQRAARDSRWNQYRGNNRWPY